MSLTEWPPLLADLKIDAKIDAEDTRDDASLQQNLSAAVAFIEGVHAETYDFVGVGSVLLPAPDVTLSLGVIRLALRWRSRQRSPDALVSMGELGAGRVPSFDVDIDRMLRIGRFAPAVFA